MRGRKRRSEKIKAKEVRRDRKRLAEVCWRKDRERAAATGERNRVRRGWQREKKVRGREEVRQRGQRYLEVRGSWGDRNEVAEDGNRG